MEKQKKKWYLLRISVYSGMKIMYAKNCDIIRFKLTDRHLTPTLTLTPKEIHFSIEAQRRVISFLSFLSEKTPIFTNYQKSYIASFISLLSLTLSIDKANEIN